MTERSEFSIIIIEHIKNNRNTKSLTQEGMPRLFRKGVWERLVPLNDVQTLHTYVSHQVINDYFHELTKQKATYLPKVI